MILGGSAHPSPAGLHGNMNKRSRTKRVVRRGRNKQSRRNRSSSSWARASPALLSSWMLSFSKLLINFSHHSSATLLLELEFQPAVWQMPLPEFFWEGSEEIHLYPDLNTPHIRTCWKSLQPSSFWTTLPGMHRVGLLGCLCRARV